MYRFIKIKDNRTGLEYPYSLWCESESMMIEHNETFMKNVIHDGVVDLLTNPNHPKTAYRGAVEVMSMCRQKSLIECSCALESEILQGKMEALLRYGVILLRECGTYMILPSSYDIIDEVTSMEMFYPEDKNLVIRLLQWCENGHYYAKYGVLDVVIDGNQKWATKEEAMKNAELFVEQRGKKPITEQP
jgi:hypothetical protein